MHAARGVRAAHPRSALAFAGVDIVADFVGGVADVTEVGLYAWVRPNGADQQKLGDLADAGNLSVPLGRVTSRVGGLVALAIAPPPRTLPYCWQSAW